MMKAECLLRLGGYKGEPEQNRSGFWSTKVRERDFLKHPEKSQG